MFCETTTPRSASGQHCYGWYVRLAFRVPGSSESAAAPPSSSVIAIPVASADRADRGTLGGCRRQVAPSQTTGVEDWFQDKGRDRVRIDPDPLPDPAPDAMNQTCDGSV
jgi:hypothetical protein